MSDLRTALEEPVEAVAAEPLAGRVGGQALTVLAGNIFTLVIGLPLQIFVSRHLGTGGLGAYSLLEGIASTIASLLGLGLAATALRFIPQYLEEGDFRAIRRLVLRGALVLGTVGALGYAAYAFSLLSFAREIHIRVEPAVVLLMGALIPLSLLTYFTQQSLRGFQKIGTLIVGSSFIQLAIKAAATVVFFSLGARLVGYAAATVMATAVALLWLAAGVFGNVSRAAMRPQQGESEARWRRFALISYGSSLISLPSSYLDRFLLAYFAGIGPVGVLAVAKQLQQLPAVLYRMLLSVAAPMFAGAHARDARAEREHLYVLTTDWTMKSALPLIVFLFVFARPVLALFGPQFAQSGALPVQILIVSQLFSLGTGPNGNMAMMSGLERETFRIDVATLIGTAVLLCLLVPAFGLMGAAVSLLASSLVHNSWTLYLVRARLGVRWWHSRYLGWLAPTVTVAAVAIALTRLIHVWTAPRLALALLAFYAIALAITLARGLHDDDRMLIALVGRRLAFR